MKKIIVFASVSISISIFLLSSSAMAATCEIKTVCIDNNHVGYQSEDCTIKSVAEIGSGFGMAESSYSCYIGCKDGACITDNTPSTCSDTDGGADYFVRGSVATKGNGDQATGADACIDKSTVSETSCGKNSSGNYTIKITPYKCPNGCSNGACIKLATAGSPTGSTCTDSDGGKDIFKAGIITINGQKDNISDTCGHEPQTITERYCLSNGTAASEEFKCPGLCEILPDTYGHAYCTKSCEKSEGYYCRKTADSLGIAFLTKDCKWEKYAPCQSGSCASICMTVGNLIDTDGDGLLDVNEAKWGTDPNKFDTDDDDYGDMTEIYGGFNPVGDGKFTPAQVVLAGQMASAGNVPTFNTDNNNLVATPTADIINSTATDIIAPAIIEPINSTSSFNTLVNTIISDFGGYVVAIIVIIFILLYIYCALCLQYIAKKLGINSLWMAWVPIANLFLILKSAGRPYWWFLLMFVPIANIIVALIPWMDIAEKLGKSKWLGLLMIVAPLNLILMGYLAFSKMYLSDRQENYTQPIS